MLYAPGLHELDQIRTLCSALTRPVNVVMGLPGVTFGIPELAEAGVKRISVGSAFSRLAFDAVMRAAREIAEHGSFTFSKDAAGFTELEDIFRKFDRTET